MDFEGFVERFTKGFLLVVLKVFWIFLEVVVNCCSVLLKVL